MILGSGLILAQSGTGGGGGGGAGAAVGGGAIMIVLIVYLAIIVFLIAALWKVFTKAGQPGWAAIIPIYNTIIMLKIAGRPIWWFILLLIPVVGLVVGILVCIDMAKNFGKGVGFAIGLILLPFIFLPILGFGSAEYNPHT